MTMKIGVLLLYVLDTKFNKRYLSVVVIYRCLHFVSYDPLPFPASSTENWTNFGILGEARCSPDKSMQPLPGQKVPFRDQAVPTIL